MEATVERVLSGFATISGGTRVNLGGTMRPWQTEIVPDPSSCIFDTGQKEGDIISRREMNGEEWWVVTNSRTPYPFHVMVVPSRCWPAERLRSLGGVNGAAAALTIAQEVTAKNSDGQFMVTVHIGATAGQNLKHLHWHVYRFAEQLTRFDIHAKELRTKYHHTRVFQVGTGFTAYAGGVFAGQSFIFPDKLERFTPGVAVLLGTFLVQVVSRYAVAFPEEKSRLPPDYGIALYVSEGEFQLGSVIPTLNHWGAAERFAAASSIGTVALPWPHELTAKALREAAI